MNHQNKIEEFVRNKIIHLIELGAITTAHIGDEIVTKTNISVYTDKIKNGSEVWLSRKYLPLFIDDGVVGHVYKNHIKDKKDFIIITDKKKVKDFNISYHSRQQFLRRLIYVTQDEFLNFSVPIDLIKIVNENFEHLKTVLENEDWHDTFFIEMMIDLMQKSEIQTPKTVTRRRDAVAIKKRERKYGHGTVRLVSHPFVFIVDEKNVKTVELYSGTADCRTGNAITSNDTKWQRWYGELK